MLPPTFLTSNHPNVPSCVLPVATWGNHSMFDAWPSNVFLNFVSDFGILNYSLAWNRSVYQSCCSWCALFGSTVFLSLVSRAAKNTKQVFHFKFVKKVEPFQIHFCYYVDVKWDALILVFVYCVYVSTDRLWVLVTAAMSNWLHNKFVI